MDESRKGADLTLLLGETRSRKARGHFQVPKAPGIRYRIDGAILGEYIHVNLHFEVSGRGRLLRSNLLAWHWTTTCKK